MPAQVVSATLGTSAEEVEKLAAKSRSKKRKTASNKPATLKKTITQARQLWVDRLKLEHPDLKPYVVVDDTGKLWRANQTLPKGVKKARELHELRGGEKRMIVNILNDVFRERNPLAALKGTIAKSSPKGKITRKEVALAEVLERAGSRFEKILLVRVEDEVVKESGGWSILVNEPGHSPAEPLFGYWVIGLDEKTLAHPRGGDVEPYTLPSKYYSEEKLKRALKELPPEIQLLPEFEKYYSFEEEHKLPVDLWWVLLHEVMHGASPAYDKEYRSGPSPDEDVWTFLYEWGWEIENVKTQPVLNVHREVPREFTPIIDLSLYEKKRSASAPVVQVLRHPL